jgi:hypothetical protein
MVPLTRELPSVTASMSTSDVSFCEELSAADKKDDGD